MQRLPGPVEEKTTTLTRSKEHVWEAYDWLNNTDGSRVCRVCGVTEVTNAVIRVDRVGLPFHYRDAHGVAFSSMVEIPCPAYVGDTAGAVAEAKMRVRDVTHRVTGVEDRVESVEDRLARLEAENEELRAQVSEVGQQAGDAATLLRTLVKMAEEARRTRQIGMVNVRGQDFRVPLAIIDVIDVVGEQVGDGELIAIPVVPEPEEDGYG